ncbi:hypothetical protein [Paenibacillus sp. 1P07SE]|uniref:hypothetical protein n=1 Tax=Paenibacillus sp. 1P07SE TaxID=3132209 RepID=UPI0039A787FF
MEEALFIFFSSLESVAVISIALVLFRYRLREVYKPAILIAMLMAVQSLLLRSEYELASFVPLINAILLALLLTTFLKIPIHWSGFVALGGYIAVVLMQAVIVELSFGWLSVAEVQSNPNKGYLLQSLTALITFLLSRYLYSRGLGFSFEFDQKRLKWEKAIILTIIFGTLMLSGLILYKRDALIDIIALTVAMGVFLYFSVRRESKE